MSDNCQSLFDNHRYSVRQVFSHVFTIVRKHWKPLFIIQFAQIVSFLCVSTIIGIFVKSVFSQMIADILNSEILPKMSDVNFESLTDIFEALTKILEVLIDWAIKYAIQLVEIVIAAIISTSLVTSTFIGAMTHAAADAYNGDTPEAVKNIRSGLFHIWTIFFYLVLFLFLSFTIFLVTIVTGIAARDNLALVILIVLSGLAFLFYFVTVMVGAIPSIIVEGKSFVAAISRSFHLCKGEFCFIFCNYFCAQLFLLISTIIIQRIFGILPYVIALFLSVCNNFLVSILFSILPFVIYISIRIQKENFARDNLCQELSGNKSNEISTEPEKKKLVSNV